MKNQTPTETATPVGVPPPAPGSTPVLFPRNPQRDEQGNAVLYPGMPKFVGVAGLFTTEDGEVVILAPTFEALDAHVRRMGVAAEISREKCIITEARRCA